MTQTGNRMYGIKQEFELQITLAGFDAAGLQVIQSRLTPDPVTGLMAPAPLSKDTPAIITKSFRPFLAGIRNFDEPILNDPEAAVSGISGSDLLAIETYAKAKKLDHGDNLDLLQMKQLAVALEKYSEFKDTQEIGGDVQIAILAHGSISLEMPPSAAKFDVPALPKEAKVGIISMFDPSFGMAGTPFSLDPNTLVAVVRGTFQNITHLTLSNISFTRTTFDGVAFRYDATGPVLFDQTNAVTNSTLELGAGISLQDRFAKYMFTTHFPTSVPNEIQ